VEVLSGHDLQACDFNGFSDPYCVLSCGKMKRSTEIKKKTLNPVWNEVLALHLVDAAQIDVVVWDWDFGRPDDVCGSAVLVLNQDLLSGERIEVDVPLSPQGMVKMVLEFRDEHCLFGLDITTACLRENRAVPFIVEKCIDAVNGSGLSLGMT
jgi:Ca2+-dependent lipid-binding protein